MNQSSSLFDGKILGPGNVSNEKELTVLCPKEFFDSENPWSLCAAFFILHGTKMLGWKWKTQDYKVRVQQALHLEEIMASPTLEHDHRQAIAGWMLSEMLREVPNQKIKSGR